MSTVVCPCCRGTGQIPGEYIIKRCKVCGYEHVVIQKPGETWTMGRCPGCMNVVEFVEGPKW